MYDSGLSKHVVPQATKKTSAFSATAGLVVLLLFAFCVVFGSPVRAESGDSKDVQDVNWGLAPLWPFRGVVAHYGDESQYMPWLEYRNTDELGLQFLDTEHNLVSHVLLDHYFNAGELICAWVQSSYDADGITWVWRDGYISRGRRSWYVPWGDFAYPLFFDDVADVIDSEANLEYDEDRTSETLSVGTDGRMLAGWWVNHFEPACPGVLVFATHAVTGDVVACGWSRSSALFVDPAMTSAVVSSEQVNASPDAPLYEACGLLDLRQWQQTLDEPDGM